MVTEIDPTNPAVQEMAEVIKNATTRRTHQPMDFVRHPTPRQQTQTDEMRRDFKFLRDRLLLIAPDCRERSLALTHLEDAQSRAVQAIMYHRVEGEPDEEG